MKTGCLNWNELTATVATRPRAWRAASTLPAVSTCDMIQPPKMSPCWFASAGIGTTRRTGSLPSGSDIFLWSFMAGRLADFLRSRKRRDILDAERARRVARLVDAPHLEVGALEIRDITRDVEQRMRIAIAPQALLQFPEFARVRGKVDRKPLVFRRILRDRLVQSEPMQQARAEARNGMFSRESDDRDAAPEGVGAGRVRVPAAGIQEQVGQALPRQMFGMFPMPGENEPRWIDSSVAGVPPEICFSRALLQPQHAVRHGAKDAHPRSECCWIDFLVPMKRAKNEFAVGQALFAAGRRRRDRKAPVRSGQVGMRQPSDLFGKEGLGRCGHGRGVTDEVVGKSTAQRGRVAYGQHPNRRRPQCEDMRPSAAGIAIQVH